MMKRYQDYPYAHGQFSYCYGHIVLIKPVVPTVCRSFNTVPLLCPLAAATGSGGRGGAAEGAGAGPDTNGQYDPREGGGV